MPSANLFLAMIALSKEGLCRKIVLNNFSSDVTSVLFGNSAHAIARVRNCISLF